jgi:hypothetical protein
MSRSEVTDALRVIATHPDPPADLFTRVAVRARRRARMRYAVASAVAVLMVTATATVWADRQPDPATSPLASPSRSASSWSAPGAGPSRGTTTPTSTPCGNADLGVYFAFVQPPQGGGSTRVGGLTVYNRSSRPCRITGLVRLTALDASGQSIPLRGTGSSGPIGMTLPASTVDDPLGLQVSVRADTNDTSTGSTCPAGDRDTPARFRLAIGQAVVTFANQPAHSEPLWGCHGTLELLQAD